MRKSKWAQLGLTIFMSVSGIFNGLGLEHFEQRRAPPISAFSAPAQEIQIPQNSPSYRVKQHSQTH
jgi:hypothetical protein